MSSFILCDFERWVAAPPHAVRSELTGMLRRSGFEIGADAVSMVEATRGSQLVSSAMILSKLPVAVIIRLAPGEAGNGTGLSVRIEDRWKSPLSKAWGLNGSYRSIFAELHRSIDEALGRLDPSATAHFGEPRLWCATGEAKALDKANAAMGSATEKVARRAARLLEGRSKKRAPQAWKGVTGVRFESPAGVLALDLDELSTRLTVAALITMEPGSMPPALSEQLQVFASKVEATLEGAGRREVVIPVTDEERKIVEFLHLQARIRDSLPMRILTTCEDCHFQKVSNPDLERLRRRNDRLRNITSGLGATFSPSGASPFVVFGTFFRMQKLDPDFVCPRCQGMQGVGRIVAFCPGCGERRDEAVLMVCGKCRHDFRKGLPRDPVWQPAIAGGPAGYLPAPGASGVAPPGPGTALESN